MKKNYRRMAKNTIKDMRNRVLENPDIIKTIKNPSDEIIKSIRSIISAINT